MWQRIKNSFRNFMNGRHGADQLSLALLIGGLIISLLGSISNLGILSLLGFAAYVWALFRTFSKNNAKRFEENQKYLNFYDKAKSETKQFFARLKNMKQYKYFHCPQCKARLRLPRKVGEVTVTCGKCRHQFKQKA